MRMQRPVHLILVAVVAVAAFAADTEGSIDWSNVTWTAGSLSNTYYSGDTAVTFTFTDFGSSIVSGNPLLSSGVSGFDDVLQCRMDVSATPEPPTQYFVLTVTFSQPVKETSFSLADIDAGGAADGNGLMPNWQDVVVVSAFLNTTEKTVSTTSVGSAVSVDSDGNDYSTSNNLTLYADVGSVPSTGAGNTNGNVAVLISGWIDKFTVAYYPGRNVGTVAADGVPLTGPTDASSQFIRFHDVRFVPEPGGLVLFGVGLMLAGVWQRRRVRRRKSEA